MFRDLGPQVLFYRQLPSVTQWTPPLPTQVWPEAGGDRSTSRSLAPSSGPREQLPSQPPSLAAPPTPSLPAKPRSPGKWGGVGGYFCGPSLS